LILVLSGLAGCVVTVSNDGGGNGSGQPPAPTTITVNIVNDTNVALDPQVFIAANNVSATDAFAPVNQFTDFGVGSLGILDANDSATLTVDCDAAAIIATQGGIFGNDLNHSDGQGQQIVLRQNESVFCGSTVTFTYTRAGSGFTTTFKVN
jgi:hypothetical protein